ncbi:methyltransferase domain-containing protein [Aquihabitans sp. G128]|uniref:methyltransferase domain-containing protein n=1 Tax=Aquihabitans sp. G128 TaxID=2849779 RepID=UPI001C239A06|nr:methyltransferase domain-containing protein [Aquihabitans sp. G128]QXC61471.1 methyltransferase domain-containing protein [Aquihabitans sp. G128]
MHRPTIDVYEREAEGYAVRRGVQREERVRAFAGAVVDGARRLDLGCGPGHYLPLLGRPAVAVDATAAMVGAAHRDHPEAAVVQADLADLPFGRGTFAGVWASKAHQHLPAADLPLALADVHRVLAVGGRFDLTVFATPDGGAAPTVEELTTPESGDDLPGRLFTWWQPDHLAAVVAAAGFRVDRLALVGATHQDEHARIELTATSLRALPDHVGTDMRLLCCGLNPSLHAADAGVGYVTGSNRFWRAMAAAGLATRDRDPRHLLRHDHVGMTDLVKRATARADELRTAEYREGLERLDQLCAWLQPAAVAVVGLAGWRAAVDRKAVVGWQERAVGGSPVYVLPSTSGLNAGTSLADLVGHLLAAADGPT